MSTTVIKSAPELEALKVTTSERQRVYILWYRKGNEVLTKNFLFQGKLKDAIERGRSHCNKMGYVCMFVRPFIVDLEHQESLRNESYEPYETLDEAS